MNRYRWLVACVAVCGGVGLLLDRGDAGGDKAPWKPIVPKEAYQELAQREADIIRELLKGKPDEEAVSRAKFGAVLIAALTMSVKDPLPADQLRGTRETALALAAALDKKDQLDAARKLAAALPKGEAQAKADTGNWGGYLKKNELMDHMRVKSKGGDGMHPDLQSNIRLKGALNGIEEKIRALSMKEMTAAGAKKEAKELELLGYRTAVVGSLTYYYAPTMKKGEQNPDDWRNWSVQMRDAGVALAQAAKKENPADIYKTSNNLNSACSQCHTIFR